MNDFAPFRITGHCPICRRDTAFEAIGPWLRDELRCTTCPNSSVPRERALALVLAELRPNWRELAIHESSPAKRGISLVMRNEAPGYVASQFFPGKPAGEIVSGFRNEDLGHQTFADASFDIVVTLDVMEHVFDPAAVCREVFRTLKVGGIYICTFPVRKEQIAGWERRAIHQPDGSIEHLKPPEIHGNPVDKSGSLVTVDYGYDLHMAIAGWAPFDVRVYRFADAHHGILGENTEVIVCHKRRDIAVERLPAAPAAGAGAMLSGKLRRWLRPRVLTRWLYRRLFT